MLKRSVIIVLAGLVMFCILACNLPVFAGFPIPDIPFLNPFPQETPTVVSLAPAATVPVTATASVAVTMDPKGAISTLDETETPTSSQPTLLTEGNPTLTPLVIIQFNTPTLQVGVEPTGSPWPKLPAEFEPTRPPLPTVELLPQPTMSPTLPAPTPVPLPLEPTTIAPDEGSVTSAAPEVIWIEDLPGFLRSKVMGWLNGASYPLFSDKDYISRIGEFNVSPGGAWLAYTTIDSPNIWQVNTTSGEQRQVSPQYPWWCYRFPAWSPDGTSLAFVAGADSAPWVSPAGAGLWTSTPDGSDLKQVGKGMGWANRQILLSGWYPTGKELIYAVPGFPGTLLPQWFKVPVDTGDSQSLPLVGTLYDISADGSWLLGDGYTNTWSGGRQEFSFSGLVRVPIDGGTPQVLTPDCRSDVMGQISPDGTLIAFLSMPSIGPTCPRLSGPITYQLWVMNSDGTGRRQIEIEGFVGRNSPQWSLDGSSIYYSAWDSKGSSLWKVDASGSTPPVQLAQTEGVDRFTVVR